MVEQAPPFSLIVREPVLLHAEQPTRRLPQMHHAERLLPGDEHAHHPRTRQQDHAEREPRSGHIRLVDRQAHILMFPLLVLAQPAPHARMDQAHVQRGTVSSPATRERILCHAVIEPLHCLRHPTRRARIKRARHHERLVQVPPCVARQQPDVPQHVVRHRVATIDKPAPHIHEIKINPVGEVLARFEEIDQRCGVQLIGDREAR